MGTNGWSFLQKTKHETWVYDNAPIEEEDTININFHRRKGQGMEDNDLKKVAKMMKIEHKELINLIRENKKMLKI